MSSSLTGRTDGFIGATTSPPSSPRAEPYKGLDVKPIYAYCTRAASWTRAITARVKGAAACSIPSRSARRDGGTAASDSGPGDRHTIGVDAKWRSGPWSVDPTVFYQFGSRDIMPTY